jgi:hypothetical protein
VSDAHRRGNASERVHQNHSRWASGSGVVNDRPPFQPPRCRGPAVRKLQKSDSTRISGSRATFNATSLQALAHLNQVDPESIGLGEEAVAQWRSSAATCQSLLLICTGTIRSRNLSTPVTSPLILREWHSQDVSHSTRTNRYCIF